MSASQPCEIGSDTEEEIEVEADVSSPKPQPASRKRGRSPARAVAKSVSIDLTGDTSEEDEAREPDRRRSSGAGSSGSGSASASADGSYSGPILIDLCGDDDDTDCQSQDFAQSLNLLFDGVEVVSERRRTAPERKGAGSGHAVIELLSDDDDVVEGCGGGGARGGGAAAGPSAAAECTMTAQERIDAKMAAKLQAQINADTEAEEAERSRAADDDAHFARALQARLAREIAEGEAEGPYDLLQSQRAQIRTFLATNAVALKVQDVWSNPAAAPGGHLYTRFAAAHEATKDKAVRLVFHGTRDENIEDICQNGLDPSKRGKNGQAYGAGEYFADNPSVSIPYCAGGRRMLVFAVLMDKQGVTQHNRQNGILVINKPEHQLPMFVLTFQQAGAAAGGNPFAGIPAHLLAAMLSSAGSSAAMLAQIQSMIGGRVPGGLASKAAARYVALPRPRGKAKAKARGRRR